jgi:ribosomal-protein-alanine N-acetyltransferase
MRLETERLVLRPLSIDDLDDLAGFLADPETMRYIGPGEPRSREQARQSLTRMIEIFEARGYGQLAVVRKPDGAFLGRCGILLWDPSSWTIVDGEPPEPVETEIGYLLGREHWGQGYATEAAIAVRDWAVEHLTPRLVALIYPENTRSAGVARKLGMAREREIEIFEKALDLYSLGNGPAR